jgi:ribonuclease BN (tRNA processing enzyme)
MELSVLGCHGGETPRHRTTSFLVNGRLAIDAGALTSGLPLQRQLQIDHILITHAHLDHVKDLATLADNVFGKRKKPVRILCTRGTFRSLRRHFFNDKLWPDFTALPSARRPTVELVEIPFDRPVKVGSYSVTAVRVAHPVESVGFLLSDHDGTLAISGDTGPTNGFWKAVNAVNNLKTLLVEVSFPNAMQALADVSMHLTPRTLAGELGKLTRGGFPILLYHLKPAYMDAIQRDLKPLLRSRPLVLPDLGQVYRF